MCRLRCSSWLCRGCLTGRIPIWLSQGCGAVALLEAPEDDVETGGDGTVPVPGGVLVAVTGGGVGMAETGHQLALGGAGPGGEGAGRVAQVVDVQLVVPHLLAGPAPVLVEGRGREEATALGGKEERVRVVADAVEVPGERVEDELGESDHPPACLGLGLGKEATSAVEAHDLFFDGDRAGVQVDVAAPKREELAEAQASEAGEEDIARNRGVIASASSRTSSGPTIGRSTDRSVPAPRTRQGLAWTRPSATAVERIARSSR